MKCSLLTLSTFIDGELAAQRHTEVDAHLVGCTRCSAGAATLREEKARVGQLARVTVDAGSAQLMLEQVGIAIDSVGDLSPAIPPPMSPPADAQRPWQGGEISRALPWTPRRPEIAKPRPEQLPLSEVTSIGPDVQPDLPLEGVRSAPPSWDKLVEHDPPPSLTGDDDLAAAPSGESAADPAPVTSADWVDADEEWLGGAVTPDSWEEDLPPVAAASPAPAVSEDLAAVPDASSLAPPPAAPPTMLMPAPPTRLAAASGPAALWARVRDAVTVRLALARGGDSLEDTMQIVSGAPSPQRVELPALQSPPVVPSVAERPVPSQPIQAQPEPPPVVELNGVPGGAHPAPVADFPGAAMPVAQPIIEPRPAALTHAHALRDIRDPIAAGGWNAFAASSYAGTEIPADDAPPPRPRPIGRHTRAVARVQVPLAARLRGGVLALGATTEAAAAFASTRVRQGFGRLSRVGPDSRLFAGVAGIGLIFVVALLVGRASARPVAPIASRPSTASSAAQPRPTAPASSSAAATGAPAAGAPTQVQTFGAGGTGFQVIRLRYGVQASYMRVVFDLGAASGAAAGTPRVTVAYSTPTTVLVTFDGTLPAGSTGTPSGKVISSVTLVSASGGRTVYRFDLTRATTAIALYLVSPTRFVLDLH